MPLAHIVGDQGSGHESPDRRDPTDWDSYSGAEIEWCNNYGHDITGEILNAGQNKLKIDSNFAEVSTGNGNSINDCPGHKASTFSPREFSSKMRIQGNMIVLKGHKHKTDCDKNTLIIVNTTQSKFKVSR